MSQATQPLCPGAYSEIQKLTFSSSLFSTMALHKCHLCGVRSFPDLVNGDWVPTPHHAPEVIIIKTLAS
jgi:hypothetical protein